VATKDLLFALAPDGIIYNAIWPYPTPLLSNMRLLLSRSERMGSRLRRSGTIFVAQQKRETLD